jgi:hypothetical protein
LGRRRGWLRIGSWVRGARRSRAPKKAWEGECWWGG